MTHSVKEKFDNLHTFVFKTLILISLFSLLITTIDLQASVNKLWNYRPQAGFVDTSPAVGDLDDDGVKDLVFCTVAGRVLALNSLGLRMWYYDVKEPITTPPLVADLNNDKSLEVLTLTNNGKIICLNGANGKLIWKYQMLSQITWGGTSLAVSGLQDNGNKKIIAADNAGNLICLNGDGSVQWSKKVEDKFNTTPAIGRLTKKGQKNILIGSDRSPLICFSSKGKELWRVNGEKSSGSGPLICDLEGDQASEILVGTGREFIVFDNNGKKIWSYKMRGVIHDAISFGDLDDDGKMEVIVADLIGDVVALNNTGRVLWKANATQRVRRSAAIADIDGDFKPEVLIAGYSSTLFVYNADGSLKNQIPLKGAMNGSPTVVDFKSDGNINVVCGANSALTAFSWENQKQNSKPLILFAEYRCNSLRTGTAIKENKKETATNMDIEYGGVYVGDNIFQVTVYNHLKKRLKLQLKINRDGVLTDKVIKSSDTLIIGKMYYNIYGRKALNIEFSANLTEKGKTIIRKSHSFYVVPFAKDIYDLKEKLAKINSMITDNGKTNQYETDRILVFSYRLQKIEEKTDVAATLPMLELSELKNSISVLRKDINTFYKMSQAAHKVGNSFAAYSANPWAPFGGVDEIMENRLPEAKVSIKVFRGEIESAAINIANYAGYPITLRIEPLTLISEKDSAEVLAKDVFEFHEVLNVPTQAMDYSADALPLLNQAQTMMVANREVRQLWINVNTKALTPGLWKGVIQLRSLEVESKKIDIPVRIKVWKTTLPEKQLVRLCHWGYVHSSRLKNYPQEALWDQVEHGTNVFVATNAFAPVAKFDSEGNIVGNIDYSKHDEYVQNHVKDGLILFFNYQSSLKGTAERMTPVWQKAYKVWLKAWIEHLKNMGVTYDQFAFYPIDEPGLRDGLVERYIAHGKIIREVDAKAQIYTDPIGRTTMDELKSMTPYVDIWCPNRNGFLLSEGQDKLAYLKTTGKTVWTYECIGNAKHLSPLGYYRAQAWLIWHYGLTGMGFWSYCTSSADPWYVPEGTLDYLLIYQGKGVVSSKRWEAIRDGIEDYGILNELRVAVEKSKDKSLSKYINEANALLKTDAFEIARYCGLDEYGTEPGIGGMKELRQIEDARWKKIKKIRRKIAQLLDVLKK